MDSVVKSPKIAENMAMRKDVLGIKMTFVLEIIMLYILQASHAKKLCGLEDVTQNMTHTCNF